MKAETPLCPAALNTAQSAETRDIVGAQAFKKLLGRFGTEVEETLLWLSGDAKLKRSDIAARAHKVAGSAAVLGAVEPRAALKALEGGQAGGADPCVAPYRYAA